MTYLMSVLRSIGNKLLGTGSGYFAGVSLGCIIAVLAATGSACAGSPPEKPLTNECGEVIIAAQAQRVCGTLNPESNARAGYYFAYAEGDGCAGGSQTPEEPEVDGEAITVSAELGGLSPDTTYSYCLVATNQFGEAFGDPLSFRTPAEETPPAKVPPENVDGLMPSPVLFPVPSPLGRARRHLAKRLEACRGVARKRRARCRRNARARFERERRAAQSVGVD
ncbi:MAG TPA: fibronectin type III domain-containing protein [Solirubrobacterales bacterium]|nr:fibronectin type III domain-containing protein [Solirubrobacterales bacterium]